MSYRDYLQAGCPTGVRHPKPVLVLAGDFDNPLAHGRYPGAAGIDRIVGPEGRRQVRSQVAHFGLGQGDGGSDGGHQQAQGGYQYDRQERGCPYWHSGSPYTVSFGAPRSGSLKPRRAGSELRRRSHSHRTAARAPTTRPSRKRPASDRSMASACSGSIGLR